MFVFGHLGFGSQLANPWSRRLPKLPLFLGMLLPDLIDKSLYYGKLYLARAGSMEWISCTRTIGHSGALLLAVMVITVAFRSKWFGALTLGMATHALLDCFMDRFYPEIPSSALIALKWPFLTHQFADYHFDSIGEHLGHLFNWPIIASEAIGILLLSYGWAKSRTCR